MYGKQVKQCEAYTRTSRRKFGPYAVDGCSECPELGLRDIVQNAPKDSRRFGFDVVEGMGKPLAILHFLLSSQ